MKKMVFLAMTCLSYSTMAASFGTDGASLEPVPTKNSVQQAKELYMKVKAVKGKKFGPSEMSIARRWISNT